jgi:opacity protein-like surface antigen
MRTAKVLGALALAGTLASPTFAQIESGWRLGMGIASEKLEGELAIEALATEPVDTNVERFGYNAFLGYTFNNWIAVEVGYNGGTEFNQNLPDFAEQVEFLPPDPPGGVNTPAFFVARNDFKSLEASAVVSWWISDKFSLFGRGGFLAWRDELYLAFGDLDVLLLDPPPDHKVFTSTNDNGVAPLFGVGVQTTLDGALIRLEYKYADIGDLNFGTDFPLTGSDFSQQENSVSSLSLSLVWLLR